MLKPCPECQLQVSDKATFCPHCGFPFRPSPATQLNKSHKRLPNGFGQISKLKKNLRNPYRAMATIGWKPNGRPNCKIVGYYASYNDAYAALVKYNKNPYSLDQKITVKELYARWTEEHFKKVGTSRIKDIKALWKHCNGLENIKAQALKTSQIKLCLESIESLTVRNRTRTMLSQMLDYAIEWELVDRNCAKVISLENVKTEKHHKSFDDAQISMLWEKHGDLTVDMALVQCYTGLRPNELCSLLNENVFEDHMIGGSKTEAGRDRYIPIHSAIKPIIEQYKNEGKYLFGGVAYIRYYKRFVKRFPDNTPHDLRKTFITLAKRSGMNDYAIKYIVGHSIQDLTEGTYTDRDPKWLNSEVEKIKTEI